MVSSASRGLVVALLGCSAAIASAAHAKAHSVEPLAVDFQIGASGEIEASFNPPIQGVVRIIVQTKEPANSPDQGNSAPGRAFQSERQTVTLEVTQWDRSIPYRLVDPKDRHRFFGGRPGLIAAEIDVNDLTPGVPVHIILHSNRPPASDSAQPDLEAHAFAVVY